MNVFKDGLKKKLTVFVTLFCALLFCVSGNVFAASGIIESDTKITYGNGKDNNLIKIIRTDENGDVMNPSEDISIPRKRARAAQVLPSKYDARNYNGVNYVTAVKDQGDFGSCWTFGANSALEAAVIRNGLGDRNSVDISEAFLIWYGYNSYISNTSSSTYADGFSNRTKGKNSIKKLADLGGNPFLATSMYASSCGIADEDDYGYNLVYHGETLAEANRYKGNYKLLGSKSILQYYPDFPVSDNEQRQKYINIIKNALLEYKVLDCGACYITSDRYVKTDSQKNTWSQYQNVYRGVRGYMASNHEVSIIGYDDNYSKDNFSITPPGDGAWLIKNSWGEGLIGDGYNWISYYDESISDVTAYDVGANNAYDNIYQYDGGVVVDQFSFSTNSVDMSNIYTAKGSEVLDRVGFFTSSPNMKYDIKVYKNLKSTTNPTSGTLVQGGSGTCDFNGYYTIKLNNNVALNKGERFSVVITLSMPNTTDKLWFFAEDTKSDNYFGNGVLYNNFYAKKGQSFIKRNGTWYDVKTAGINNIPIKAFTKKAEKLQTFNFNNTDSNIETYVNENVKIGYTYTPSTARCDINFTSSDSSVARVTPSGKIIGMKEGNAIINAVATDGEKEFKHTYNVKVNPSRISPLQGVSINKTSLALKPGGSSGLIYKVYPSNATYKVTATSSDRSVATVAVKSNGISIGTIMGNNGSSIAKSESIDLSKNIIEDKAKDDNVSISEKTEVPIRFFLNQDEIKLNQDDKFNLSYYTDKADVKDITFKSMDEEIAVVNEDGVISAINKGETSVSATVKYNGKEYSDECKIKVISEDDILESSYIKQNEVSIYEGKDLDLINSEKLEDAQYKSLDEKIAVVDENGRITGVKAGETVIEISGNDGINNILEECIVNVVGKNEDFVLPDISLDVNINEDILNDLEENNDKDIAKSIKTMTIQNTYKSVTLAVRALKVGNTTLTVQSTDGVRTYKRTCSVSVRLAKPTFKVTAGKKKATVKITRLKGATYYQIQRSTKKKSGFKTVKTTKSLKFVNKKLKKKKTYYYRVRGYATYKGKKYYSAWSTVKKVKTK